MVHVTEDQFGTAINPVTKKSEAIRRFTLTNAAQMSVQVITRGATITSFKVPDAAGHVDDIVLGYDDVAGYQTATNPYFGATVGRVCNRIANGRFPLPGHPDGVSVARNYNDKHQLHGGFIGFDKVHWTVAAPGPTAGNGSAASVTLQHHSPAGWEGYPGALTATVCFTLAEDNCLHVRMAAEVAAEGEGATTTVVNMTNHSYFNLAGHDAGPEAIYAHTIQIQADHITETDADSIPTGNLLPVRGGPYDLRRATALGERMRQLPASVTPNGFDDNFCVELRAGGAITPIAKAHHAGSGRWLEIASNQPGVQFYTSNFMPDAARGEQPIVGKAGARYWKHGAFCLETQKWPDAPNHDNFPSIILRPGEQYQHDVIYKFGICRGGACSP